MHRSTHSRARRAGMSLLGILCAGLASPTLAAAAIDLAPVLAPASAEREPFTIAGNLTTVLYPGGGGPLDLRLTNPDPAGIRVTGLTVEITEVRAGSALGCTARDFAVEQLAGEPELRLPGSSTTALSALGVSPADLPAVRMRDTAVNQDGCQNSTLTLAYRGTAIGQDADTAPTAGEALPADLPGTGADGPPPWTIALAGLALVGAGAGSVHLARRRHTTLATAGPARRTN